MVRRGNRWDKNGTHVQPSYFVAGWRSVSTVFSVSGPSGRSHHMSRTGDEDGADPQCMVNAKDMIEADFDRRDILHAAQIAS
eukprot:IDg10654t1